MPRHRRFAAFAGLLTGLLLGLSPQARAGNAFEEAFRRASAGDLDLTRAQVRAAQGHRYVFIAGFRGDQLPGSFATAEKELRHLGVPRSSLHLIRPETAGTREDAVALLRTRLDAIAKDGGGDRLILIAHSRGATATLDFALRHPDFVRDRVDALYLIQGPFGGSGLADQAAGLGPAIDRQMPTRYRVAARIAAAVFRASAGRKGDQAVREMTTRASRDYWRTLIRDRPDAVAVVGPRTFFIRSSIPPDRLRFFRRALAWYLRTYQGASGDGMVAVADQWLPDLGTVIGTVEAGHSDLAYRRGRSRGTRRLPQALIQAIVVAVAHRDEPATPAISGRRAP